MRAIETLRGVTGKNGLPVTRYVIEAPEMHHITDKPPVGAFMGYERMSRDTRRRQAWAGFAYRMPMHEKVLGIIFGPWTSVAVVMLIAASMLMEAFK